MPLLLKVPAGYEGYKGGSEFKGEIEVGDIAPTIYRIMGWEAPGCVDGKPLPSP
jgi:bisphosphoglycerate-independent phosphoglycerate mutase (AlkP superfamily)